VPERLSIKAQSFTESVIREMTRLNLELNGPDRAVNFDQGFPDFNTDARILDAAANTLRDRLHGLRKIAVP
jgi:aspartate/methionine/tyrosine aminotransferase